MGNKESRGDTADVDTLKNRTIFKSISSNKPELCRSDLEKFWMNKISAELRSIILDFLFLKKESLSFQSYNEFSTAMLRGTFHDKGSLLLQIMECMDKSLSSPLREVVMSVFINYVKAERSFSNLKAWREGGVDRVKTEELERLVTYVLQLAGNNSEYTVSAISSLLGILDRFLMAVFSPLLGFDPIPSSFLPKWQRLVGDVGRPLSSCSQLLLEDVIFLNTELPVDYQMEWRLLFSTKIHGESFSRLAGQITNQGPSVLIVEDKDGHRFGGFAPSSWCLGPNFSGDPSSFLFTLRPEMQVYPATNFNENFQYMNQGQQTLPNGLGMGGKFEYFGLWLDSEFGKGISNESCTTYRNFKRLSKEKDFVFAEVEVWGVGAPPPTASELGERSVLDGNTEAKALLEMAGKKTYSEGLREKPQDD